MRTRATLARSLVLAVGLPAATSGALQAQPLTEGDVPSRLQFNFGRAVAVDAAGGVHVAWLSGPTLDPANPGATLGQVFYRRSPDGGAHWEAPRPMTPTPFPFTGHPKVAAAGLHVYVVWHGVSEGTLRVFLAHSPDAGAHWEEPRLVSDNPGGVGTAWPSVAAWGDEVHVVWGDGRTGAAEIYLRSSPNGGHGWTPVRRVSCDDGRSSWTPSVAAEGATVHVAWSDSDTTPTPTAGPMTAAARARNVGKRSTTGAPPISAKPGRTRCASPPTRPGTLGRHGRRR